MKKTYSTPHAIAYTCVSESMLAASEPGLNNELGGSDQLSNERDSGWGEMGWSENEE